MKENLQELIQRIVNDVESNNIDKRVETFVDYKSKYVILRPSVTVEVELTCGKTIRIDVTDYFEEVVK